MVGTLAALATVGLLAGEANAGPVAGTGTSDAGGMYSTSESYAAPQGFTRGDWLLGFAGSYTRLSVEDESINLFSGQIDASYFVMDNASIGLNTVGLIADTDVTDTLWALGLEPNLRYYFQNASSFTPYVGIHGGWTHLDAGDIGDTDVWTYGAHGGILVPLTESAYFDAALKWTEWELEDDFDLDLDTLQVLIGLKVRF